MVVEMTFVEKLHHRQVCVFFICPLLISAPSSITEEEKRRRRRARCRRVALVFFNHPRSW
jgi:hypothetical protein